MMKWNKFAFGIAVLGLLLNMTACEEPDVVDEGVYGGTIIINNNYAKDQTATVYSDVNRVDRFGIMFSFNYKDKYGPKTISPGSSEFFTVKTDARYAIVWRYGGDLYKLVQVANGDTVEVNIP